MVEFYIAAGLPPYGARAVTFPSGWGGGAREGLVVSVGKGDRRWFANFRPGLGGPEMVCPHPNGSDVLVFAYGDCWVLQPDTRSATLVACGVDVVLTIPDSPDLVMGRSGLAFRRLGAVGVSWHTRRLSWDGFDALEVKDGRIAGNGWDALNERWVSFEVDLTSGRATGGVSNAPPEDWESLAS
jgi:hypothetical protein